MVRPAGPEPMIAARMPLRGAGPLVILLLYVVEM